MVSLTRVPATELIYESTDEDEDEDEEITEEDLRSIEVDDTDDEDDEIIVPEFAHRLWRPCGEYVNHNPNNNWVIIGVECPNCTHRGICNSGDSQCAWICNNCGVTSTNPFHYPFHYQNTCRYAHASLSYISDEEEDEVPPLDSELLVDSEAPLPDEPMVE